MIRKILLPTDGSAFSESASKYAIFLAKKCGAALTALHVISVEPPKKLGTESIEKEKAKQAELCFRSVEERGKAEGVELKTKILVSRSICGAILEEAEEGGYDIIIMGSHGISGFKKFLLGSVSEAVVHKAALPVLIIHS
ncbi:MAG: universal stress protein [Euryarchaeota archaeon]|nr:universal stress protein [Euryarchaeota archaeon]